MGAQSTLVIDGAEFKGTAATTMYAYMAVTEALRELKSSDERSRVLFPAVGETDDGRRVIRGVLIHRFSSVNFTILDEGDVSTEILDAVAKTADDFMEKYGTSKEDDEPDEG